MSGDDDHDDHDGDDGVCTSNSGDPSAGAISEGDNWRSGPAGWGGGRYPIVARSESVGGVSGLEMVRFGSVRFGQGFLRTENRTIGSVQRFSRTENRTVGSVRNGPVLVLKASEPEPDLFFFFLFSFFLFLNPNL